MLVSYAMLRFFPLRLSLPGLLLGVFCAVAVPAHALERITLRNGFSYDCDRKEPLDTSRVRLFLFPDDQTSYVDIPTAEIVGVERLPNPPASPAFSEPHASSPKSPETIHTLLANAGTKHNIDVDLLASVVHAESAGRETAVSRTGAQGLMQLMPSTAHELGVTDSFEPGQNINGGTAYLDSLLTRYHDNLALALAAYNAGPGAVDRFHGVPPFRETRAYVARVINEFKRRKAVLEHQASHTLQASR